MKEEKTNQHCMRLEGPSANPSAPSKSVLKPSPLSNVLQKKKKIDSPKRRYQSDGGPEKHQHILYPMFHCPVRCGCGN
jgi:hypothetical protein